MSVELILWFFSFASVMALVGLTAYQLICLSDLEFDYINPYDSASRVNAVVIIEYALQVVLCACFLLTLNWFPFLVMAPVTYYHVKLYVLLSLSPEVYPVKPYMLIWSFSLLYYYYLCGLVDILH